MAKKFKKLKFFNFDGPLMFAVVIWGRIDSLAD